MLFVCFSGAQDRKQMVFIDQWCVTQHNRLKQHDTVYYVSYAILKKPHLWIIFLNPMSALKAEMYIYASESLMNHVLL